MRCNCQSLRDWVAVHHICFLSGLGLLRRAKKKRDDINELKKKFDKSEDDIKALQVLHSWLAYFAYLQLWTLLPFRTSFGMLALQPLNPRLYNFRLVLSWLHLFNCEDGGIVIFNSYPLAPLEQVLIVVHRMGTN